MINKHGPMWQAECTICHEMSDPFDSPGERDEWARQHDCGEYLEGRIPHEAQRHGWKVVQS